MRLLLGFVGLFAVHGLHAQIDSTFSSVTGGPYRLATATYHARSVTAPTALVVILHGDAPFTKPDYQNRFVASAARAFPIVAATILRPGYVDPVGRRSEGARGEATGDSYNAANVEAIAAGIVALQQQLNLTNVVLVGHSGGAAIAANILARHPHLASAALLVSCPCDVAAWRAHMLQKTQFAGFDGPLETLSPIDLVAGLAPRIRLLLVVGEKDDVTPPALTDAYAKKALLHGATVAVEELPAAGHEILLAPEVLDLLGAVIN